MPVRPSPFTCGAGKVCSQCGKSSKASKGHKCTVEDCSGKIQLLEQAPEDYRPGPAGTVVSMETADHYYRQFAHHVRALTLPELHAGCAYIA